MLSAQNSSNAFQKYTRRQALQEERFPENVEPDMDLKTYLEAKGLLEGGDESPDHRSSPRLQRDFVFEGFTKKFRQERFMRLLKCSMSNCRTILSGDNYGFCGKFHLFCNQCIQNLPFCSVTVDAATCGSRFHQIDIPLYSNFLDGCKFACPNVQFGCKIIGQAEAISKHFKMCSNSTGSAYVCRFTGCKTDPGTFPDLLAHLKARHHVLFVERSVTAVSLRIPWGKPKDTVEYTWIPAIFKTNGIYFLITFKLQHGKLYQWIYVEDRRPREDRGEIYILSGFDVAEKGVTMLKEDPIQSLSTSVYKILKSANCFAINLEDFIEEFMMLDAKKRIQYFTFDLDIALL